MLTAQPRQLHGAIFIHSYGYACRPRRGGSVRPRRTTKRVKADMERLYACCESCPRIEELLKAYLAHASSSSRFLLLTYYTLQLYRAIPRFHRHRYTVYAARGTVGTCICPWEGG